MTRRRSEIRALLDEGAPRSAGAAFHAAGHTVIYHSDVLLPGASDELVCIAAMQNNAILVAVDRDMKQFAKRYGTTPKSDRFNSLHVLQVGCDEVLASKRIAQAMTLIEHEWAFTTAKRARRFWIEVGPHWLRTYR